MKNKQTISFARAKKKCISDAERGKSAFKAEDSASRGARQCVCAITTGRIAVREGENLLETAQNYAERAHTGHVNPYLTVISKYRSALDCISESILKAETAKDKAENAAKNAHTVGKKLIKTARKSNIKDDELWATSAIATANQAKIDAFKAAYDVLKATKEFWLEVDDAVNLETSFRKSIHRPYGALNTINADLIIALLLGCIIIIINRYVKSENRLYYLVFSIGSSLIVGSLFTGIDRIARYYTTEENCEEKMWIQRNVQAIEKRLRLYDDYFAKNKLIAVPQTHRQIK